MGLSNYTRLKKLGKGSFGEVFLVSDNRDGAQYVMKEVDLVQFGPKGRKEALKEVAFLNAMHHPFIIGYREFFEEDPTGTGRKMLFILMEFAPNGDLDGRVKAQAATGRPFPESQIIDWFVQICLAVKHIHDRKIIHRDLKTENIFLSKTNQTKLGDFGISKSMAHTMAQAMTRIGTPYYLSPEICMNKAYNSKSDMWSLGVVLYELMSLRHPFDATSMEGLLNKIVKSQPPALPRIYSVELRTVVDSLLSKQPTKRPTVNALLKLPFLARHVQKHLPREVLEDEFSHTVIHSDMSARRAAVNGVSNPPPVVPPPNQVGSARAAAAAQAAAQAAQAASVLPPPSSRAPRPSQQARMPPMHPPTSQQSQAQPPSTQQSYYPPPTAYANEQKESQAPSRAGIRAASPFYGQPPTSASPAHREPPQQQPQHLLHRPPSASNRSAYPPPTPSSAAAPTSSAVPPSPYARMSNADKIRAIREAKERELRDLKQRQADLASERRRHALEAQRQAQDEADARQRQREAAKERQMQAQAQQAQQYGNLPPALRPGRGIAAVARAGQEQATPLNGAPYQDRAAGPTRLAQQQQQHQALAAAAAAQKAREEELARMRVNYFRERNHAKAKLAAAQQQYAGAGGGAYRAPSAYQQPQPPSSRNYQPLPPPSVQNPYSARGGYPSSRPVSGGGGGGAGAPIIVRHGLHAAGVAQQQRRPVLAQPAPLPSRWR